jgi:hypothetical protein
MSDETVEVKLTICIYDNPNTFRREAWQNGELVAFIAMSLLETKGFKRGDLTGLVPWYLDIEKWESGRVNGDPEAMKKPQADPPEPPKPYLA